VREEGAQKVKKLKKLPYFSSFLLFSANRDLQRKRLLAIIEGR
jgi:hypothetical protein